MEWTKVKSIKGTKWLVDIFATDDKRAVNKYKAVSTPTAACKKELKKAGYIAKKTIEYSNRMPR